MPSQITALLHGAFVLTLGKLAVAFVLGLAIGLERQLRQRTAGLRTNVLVAIGAAAFTDMGMQLMGAEGGVRIIAYVVSGIGFLGAGVIIKDGTNIRGLNTAATIWCSGAVGAYSGAGMPGESAALAIAVLMGNTLLRPLVNWVNRRPISEGMTEAEYRIHIICRPDVVPDVRELVQDVLEAAHYPVKEGATTSENDDQVELEVILVPNSAKEAELDAVVRDLERSALIRSAAWTAETTA